jgi:hypothetical protein
MNDSTKLQHNAHPIRREAATHLFTIGQTVRLKGGLALPSQSVVTYRITGTLPSRGESLQYRIRNDAEGHELAATQDSLDFVLTSPASPGSTLIEELSEPTK